MRRNIVLFILLLCGLTILCTGCIEDGGETAARCAKCGGVATTTMGGSAATMESYGIPLSKCRKVTSIVYSASVCEDCVGPVVEITPDPGFSGETPFYSKD